MTQAAPIYWHSRNELGSILNNKNLLGVGVEVGTQWAQNASLIRAAWKGEKLICVDPWAPYFGADVSKDQHDEIFQHATREMRQHPHHTWEFMRMGSLEAAAAIAKTGQLLDFVYIDADHDYEPFLADLKAWWPLVKEGGIVAGHDWVCDGWHRNGEPFTGYPTRDAMPPGGQCGPFFVRKALKEFLSPADFERLSLTSPDADLGWQSWLIAK